MRWRWTANPEFETGGDPTKVSFSPDGSAIAASYNDRSIRIWRPDTDQQQIIHYSANVRDITFGGQPWALLSGGWDGLIQRWDIGRGAAR